MFRRYGADTKYKGKSEDFVDVFLFFFFFFFFWGGGGVIAKLDYIWVSFLCMLGYFLKANERNGNIFWGCKNSKYSFRV